MRKLFKSCNTISIHNFSKILETEDYRYLIKGYTEDDEDDIVLQENQIIKYENIFKVILFQYSELTINTAIVADYNKRILIKALEFEYFLCLKIIELYNDTQAIEVVGLLEEFGHKIDKENIVKCIDGIIKKLEGLKNQIRIHKSNYNKKIENREEPAKVNLDKEALNFESILELKYSINPMETAVTKWVSYGNRCKRVINKRRNG